MAGSNGGVLHADQRADARAERDVRHHATQSVAGGLRERRKTRYTLREIPRKSRQTQTDRQTTVCQRARVVCSEMSRLSVRTRRLPSRHRGRL
eukprot:scaffold133327_cov64-Phaeocystis_antarctica.AAC.5